MLYQTGIRLLCVAQNPANGFPARLLGQILSPAFMAWHDASAGPLYILGQRASNLNVSKCRIIMLNAYDSGSEANSESCSYIPGPPCGNHLHDRAKAEGFVHVHAGIQGGNGSGLDPATHDWRDPVARLSIKTWKVSR